mmetsp:Transcript_107155/g.298438  ORF Transcript_107155/g.298438 Transcript_107155/m.298438 type:complete len:405 (+) Transcript_107155:254-1468(+)
MFCRSNVLEIAVPGFGVGGTAAAIGAGAAGGGGAGAALPGAAKPTTVGTPCCECEERSFFISSMRLCSGVPPAPVAPKSLSVLKSIVSSRGGAVIAGAGGATACTAICSSWPTSWKPCIDVMASCASLWFRNVIQHSWLPIWKASNSPKGLKMPRMSSSVTTGLRFLMCSFRMLGPEASVTAAPVLRPLRTCCVNCCRVMVRFGAWLGFTSWASARFTSTTMPRISFCGAGSAQARATASSSANSTMTVPVGFSWRLRTMRTSLTVPHLLKCAKIDFSSALIGTFVTTMVFSTFSTLPVKPPKPGATRPPRSSLLGGVRERLGEDSPAPALFSLSRRFRRSCFRRSARALCVKRRSSSKKDTSAKSSGSPPMPARPAPGPGAGPEPNGRARGRGSGKVEEAGQP